MTSAFWMPASRSKELKRGEGASQFSTTRIGAHTTVVSESMLWMIDAAWVVYRGSRPCEPLQRQSRRGLDRAREIEDSNLRMDEYPPFFIELHLDFAARTRDQESRSWHAQ